MIGSQAVLRFEMVLGLDIGISLFCIICIMLVDFKVKLETHQNIAKLMWKVLKLLEVRSMLKGCALSFYQVFVFLKFKSYLTGHFDR